MKRWSAIAVVALVTINPHNPLILIQYNYILSLSVISSLLPPLSSLAKPPVLIQPC
jgi:hypothetical protein